MQVLCHKKWILHMFKSRPLLDSRINQRGPSFLSNLACLPDISTSLTGEVTTWSGYFFLDNQPDALIIPILFCYKTLHVSGIFSAHHQEFSTVNSALVSFMQVSWPLPSRVRMEMQSSSISWLCLEAVIRNLTPDDGQRRCPKHVEFYNRIKFG